jgi:DNA-binding response OmpR family regulator
LRVVSWNVALAEQARILVAEDDPELNRLVVTWLKRASLEVDSVFDGEEAIRAIKEHRYSAILLDVMMPRVNGFDVINYINEHQPKVMNKVIIMTAGGEEIWEKVRGHAVYKLMTKPFDLRELLQSALECAQKRAGAQLSFSRDRQAEDRRPYRVLVVDDDAERYALSRRFASNFDVDLATDGNKAIEKLKVADYDVVLLDLGISDVDGLAVIGYLREHQKHVLDNVVLVTVPPNKLRHVVDLNIGGVIPRPIDADELASYIKAHLLRTASNDYEPGAAG